MGKKAYFLSDLHLGARYVDTRAVEARAAAFLRSIAADACDVYLMGDILDYWYEYRTVAPRGYLRFFGALAELADTGVRVHWYIGNHDIWMFDYLRDEIGMEVVDGCRVEEILGKKFYLGHGDGVGPMPTGFRFIRSVFRNKLCQKLFAAIHPRWTVPMAHAWSSKNRGFDTYSTPAFLGLEREPQAQFALQYLRDVDPTIDYFVFGHRHVLADEPLSPSCRLIILGDWITQFSYAVFDGSEMRLLKCQD